MGCIISTSKRKSRATFSTFDSRSMRSMQSDRRQAPSKPTKRMPDRQHPTSCLAIDERTEEPGERLVSNTAEDAELQAEILRREQSAVRAKVNKFDQLDAKARVQPPLVEVRKAALSRQSMIYGRVQSFEMANKEEDHVVLGPTVEECRRRRESQNPQRFSDALAATLPVFSL